MATRRHVVVVEYDTAWPRYFASLHARIWPLVQGVALTMEHVGSTSVPGLAAKAVIDADIVVASRSDVAACVRALATLGYAHRGELGIEDRHAFSRPEGDFDHNLYVCVEGCAALRNHLALRDHLLAHPEAVAEYASLKRELARDHPHDIDAYIEGKTAFIVGILQRYAFAGGDLDGIIQANLKS